MTLRPMLDRPLVLAEDVGKRYGATVALDGAGSASVAAWWMSRALYRSDLEPDSAGGGPAAPTRTEPRLLSRRNDATCHAHERRHGRDALQLAIPC